MSFPHASITVFSDGYFTLFALILLVFVAHFVMLNFKLKTILISFLSVVVAVCLVVGNINAKFTSFEIFTTHQTASNAALFSASDNTKMLVGSALEVQELKVLTNSLRIRQLDCVVANDFSFKNLNSLKEICREFRVRKLIIVYESNYALDLSAKDFGVENLEIVLDEGVFNYKNFNFYVIMYENSVIATQVSFHDKHMLFLKSGIVVNELSHLAAFNLPLQDYVFVAGARTNVRNYNLQAKNFVVIKSKPNLLTDSIEIKFGQVARVPL